MRFRNTLIALVVLAIVGGYVVVSSYFSRPEPVKTALEVKAEDLATIDLKYPGRELMLERQPGQPWQITKPKGVKADQIAANNLARAIANCEITRTVVDKPDTLAPFGLDKPPVTVTVTTTAGKTLPAIEVGKVTPVGFSAYIKYAGQPAVMLTASAFPSGMTKTLDQMRDRELMSFKLDDVKEFTIDRDNGPQIDIVRQGDNWEIVKPERYSADATQVRQLLTSLDDAKVADFIDDAPTDVAQYGLQKPHLTVTVYTGKNGGQESMLFGFKQKESGKDGIYVRRGESAPVYTVHQFVMSSLDKSPLDLRDKTVLSFDSSAVDTVMVDSGGKQFTLEAARRTASGRWSKTAPAPRPTWWRSTAFSIRCAISRATRS